LSGPILDRIDLFVEVQGADHTTLLHQVSDPTKDKADREHVAKARQIQASRYATSNRLNAVMSNEEIKTISLLTDEAQVILNTAATRLRISPRSYMRIIKVARTIADLGTSKSISAMHLTEALQYRELRLLHQ
jgi:magnesium chelatase family protein